MHYDFFNHRDCEYFPCHAGIEPAEFNCLFCYCPLYALGRECGGNFSYDNPAGFKDCSNCLVPHRRDNYAYIVEKLGVLIERVKAAPGEQPHEKPAKQSS